MIIHRGLLALSLCQACCSTRPQAIRILRHIGWDFLTNCRKSLYDHIIIVLAVKKKKKKKTVIIELILN